jgi:DNA polymerase III gamma/tau subunit
MYDILDDIIEKEDIEISKRNKKLIVQSAEGSPRQAINILEAVLGIDNDKKQAEAITEQSTQTQCIDLCRFLFNTPKLTWKAAAEKMRRIEDEPEIIRRSITGYASAILTNGQDNARAYYVLIAFEAEYPWSERSRLTRALYEVVTRIQK